MPFSNNSSLIESVDNFNARYVETLLPLTVIFGFLAFAGVIGNTVVLIVFSTGREYKKSNFKVYALFHGVIDLVTCITVIPGEIIKLIHYFAFHNGTACKVICFFNILGSGASALTFMLISVDRFRRVNKPLDTQISQRLAVILHLICIFVALLLASPTVLICGIQEESITNIHGGATNVYICLAEEKFKSSAFRMVYKVGLLIMTGVVFVTCIVMYVFIWRTVFATTRMRMNQKSFRLRPKRAEKHFDSRKDMFIIGKHAVDDFEEALAEEKPNTNKNCTVSRADNETFRNGSLESANSDRIGQFPHKTTIWFLLTVIFIATYIIHCALLLIPDVILSFPPKLFTVSSFFYRLYLISSVINPLVYALLDSRFRCTCRRIFRERICFYLNF